MAQLFTNNANSTLAAGITNVATSLTLAAGQGVLFPNPTGGDYFLMTLIGPLTGPETSWEIVKVTGRATDVLTIVRAQEGTAAVAWDAGTKVDLRLTAGSLVMGGLTPTPIKTAAYTAVVNDLVRVNSTAGVFTVTLPATPADGDKVGLFDVANQCGVNAVLFAAAGGKTVEGDAAGISVNVNGAYVYLIYNAASTNWKVAATPMGAGGVAGPASSIDGEIALFDSTTGKLIKRATTTGLLKAASGVIGPVVSGTDIKTVGGVSILGAGDVAVGGQEIITPTNTTPADAATGQSETPTLTGSTFYSNYAATHAATQVQVHTTSDFTTPQYASGDQAASTSFVMPSGQLVVSTTYYWRMRYKNSRGTYSDWSAAFSFQTAASFNSYITTPAATPAAFGDAFEGGFYSGLVWNELVESATSIAIGTGTKAFTVADMTSTPIVYGGQALEVRSRANPANKMIGTVTGANGTALTLNITSVGGSGTFTDWSVMAQYRIIVAPKSTGENSSIAFKNANTSAPSACGTLTEGRKATLAMVAADTSTVYPAAHWCNNLSIASRTDWYLPARDELELSWRNLKPTAGANYTTADRATGATPNYMNLGSYGDTANTHGLNNNSSPTGAAYTSGSPAQVAAGKNFRTSESEAFAYGSFYYWSASECSTSAAWLQAWHSGAPGYQDISSKSNAYYVRAVRRSII